MVIAYSFELPIAYPISRAFEPPIMIPGKIKMGIGWGSIWLPLDIQKYIYIYIRKFLDMDRDSSDVGLNVRSCKSLYALRSHPTPGLIHDSCTVCKFPRQTSKGFGKLSVLPCPDPVSLWIGFRSYESSCSSSFFK